MQKGCAWDAVPWAKSPNGLGRRRRLKSCAPPTRPPRVKGARGERFQIGQRMRRAGTARRASITRDLAMRFGCQRGGCPCRSARRARLRNACRKCVRPCRVPCESSRRGAALQLAQCHAQHGGAAAHELGGFVRAHNAAVFPAQDANGGGGRGCQCLRRPAAAALRRACSSMPRRRSAAWLSLQRNCARESPKDAMAAGGK